MSYSKRVRLPRYRELLRGPSPRQELADLPKKPYEQALCAPGSRYRTDIGHSDIGSACV